MVNFTVYRKVKQANVVTVNGLQKEVSKVKKEMRTMRMEPVPGMEDQTKPFTEQEMKQLVRSSHAVYDPGCELCVQTRSIVRHPKQVENETWHVTTPL